MGTLRQAILLASSTRDDSSVAKTPPHTPTTCADSGATITARTHPGGLTGRYPPGWTRVVSCQPLWGTCSSLLVPLQLPQVGALAHTALWPSGVAPPPNLGGLASRSP
jgi:hypothetical protein